MKTDRPWKVRLIVRINGYLFRVFLDGVELHYDVEGEKE